MSKKKKNLGPLNYHSTLANEKSHGQMWGLKKCMEKKKVAVFSGYGTKDVLLNVTV